MVGSLCLTEQSNENKVLLLPTWFCRDFVSTPLKQQQKCNQCQASLNISPVVIYLSCPAFSSVSVSVSVCPCFCHFCLLVFPFSVSPALLLFLSFFSFFFRPFLPLFVFFLFFFILSSVSFDFSSFLSSFLSSRVVLDCT